MLKNLKEISNREADVENTHGWKFVIALVRSDVAAVPRFRPLKINVALNKQAFWAHPKFCRRPISYSALWHLP